MMSYPAERGCSSLVAHAFVMQRFGGIKCWQMAHQPRQLCGGDWTMLSVRSLADHIIDRRCPAVDLPATVETANWQMLLATYGLI